MLGVVHYAYRDVGHFFKCLPEFKIRLTLKQHSFELCGPTYMRIFPPINTCTVLVKSLWTQRTYCVCIDLCHLMLGDLGILGFWYLLRSWNRSPIGIKGQLNFWRSQKSYADFELWESVPLICALCRSRL